jgi:hypothetical protein
MRKNRGGRCIGSHVSTLARTTAVGFTPHPRGTEFDTLFAANSRAVARAANCDAPGSRRKPCRVALVAEWNSRCQNG